MVKDPKSSLQWFNVASHFYIVLSGLSCYNLPEFRFGICKSGWHICCKPTEVETMEKRPNSLRNHKKTYQHLASANSMDIEEYNGKILSMLLLMGVLMIPLLLLTVPFNNTKKAAVSAYLLTVSLYLVMFLLFKLPAMKKHTLLGLYSSFSILTLLAIYLSVIHTPEMRATILLGVFCIMPLSFIDRPFRMNLFVAFWLVTHSALAFYLKPRYVLDDTVNCLCFALLGCFLGNNMVWIRLQSFDAHRLLIIEKETDVLTGLFNRRKLYETLAYLETTESRKPTGVLMLDIDHFKEFNDKHGHAAGDRCLSRFGKLLIQFAQTFRLQFYRYGGEEFVAIAYEYDEEELFSLAEDLRIAVKDSEMDVDHITVSIGVAYCGGEMVRNYEKVIDRADKATYTAKRTGRNRVCIDRDEERVQQVF
jgi:diguanylate cyclase (GGDEF)-like protein